MNSKNRDLDRWISGIRSPYERVFSQQRRQDRYCGIAKNQFAEFKETVEKATITGFVFYKIQEQFLSDLQYQSILQQTH